MEQSLGWGVLEILQTYIHTHTQTLELVMTHRNSTYISLSAGQLLTLYPIKGVFICKG